MSALANFRQQEQTKVWRTEQARAEEVPCANAQRAPHYMSPYLYIEDRLLGSVTRRAMVAT